MKSLYASHGATRTVMMNLSASFTFSFHNEFLNASELINRQPEDQTFFFYLTEMWRLCLWIKKIHVDLEYGCFNIKILPKRTCFERSAVILQSLNVWDRKARLWKREIEIIAEVVISNTLWRNNDWKDKFKNWLAIVF